MKDIEITIHELTLNGNTAIRILKALRILEPEIYEEFKKILLDNDKYSLLNNGNTSDDQD